MRGGRAAALLLALIVAGCETLPRTPDTEVDPTLAYDARARYVSQWPSWGFVGRLSVDDGEDGGSGRLHWQVDDERLQLDFRGALGRGAWRLTSQPGLATLERADGSRSAAADAASLVWQEIGWRIPVQALQFWVRGLHAPGIPDTLELDEWGNLVELAQLGWNIEFSRFDQEAGTAMPGRIEATRNPYRIKLVIGRWTVPEGSGTGG